MPYPYTYNIDYYIGDTYQFVLYPKNDDGTSFDISGFTAKWTIATSRGNPSAQVVTLFPQITLDPSRIYCYLDSYNGSLLTNPIYLYDIEISKQDESYTLLTGQITTENQVTISYSNIEIIESDVIIDGGIPTSIYYQVFDGGTP